MPHHKAKKPVSPRFAEVTQLVVETIPGIQTLQLVKSIYFLEWEYLRKFGEPLTDVPIIRITMGPVPANYEKLFPKLAEEGYIHEKAAVRGYNTHLFYKGAKTIESPFMTRIELELLLPILASIKNVIVQRPREASEIIKQKSYETAPMKRYVAYENEIGRKRNGGYVLRPPYVLQDDIDPLAEYRRTYRDHLRTAAPYGVEDAALDAATMNDLRPFLTATNAYANTERLHSQGV